MTKWQSTSQVSGSGFLAQATTLADVYGRLSMFRTVSRGTLHLMPVKDRNFTKISGDFHSFAARQRRSRHIVLGKTPDYVTSICVDCKFVWVETQPHLNVFRFVTFTYGYLHIIDYMSMGIAGGATAPQLGPRATSRMSLGSFSVASATKSNSPSRIH